MIIEEETHNLRPVKWTDGLSCKSHDKFVTDKKCVNFVQIFMQAYFI